MIFNQARYHHGLGFDWTTGAVRACLLLKGAWTPNADDDAVATATIAGATIRGNRYTPTGKTVTLDDANDRALWDCNTLAITGVTLGQTYDALLIYTLVTNDADSWLLGLFDTGARVGDGTTIMLTPDPAGLFAW